MIFFSIPGVSTEGTTKSRDKKKTTIRFKKYESWPRNATSSSSVRGFFEDGFSRSVFGRSASGA